MYLPEAMVEATGKPTFAKGKEDFQVVEEPMAKH